MSAFSQKQTNLPKDSLYNLVGDWLNKKNETTQLKMFSRKKQSCLWPIRVVRILVL